MAISSSTPVLSLSTLVECPVVAIDGERYALHPADSLSLFVRMELEATERQLSQLLSAPARTNVEKADVARLLDQVCRKVLEAPDAVHAKLTDVQRMLICEVFIRLPRASRLQTEAARPRRRVPPLRGANSSVGSPGSTAGVPSNGSARSRSGSSARRS